MSKTIIKGKGCKYSFKKSEKYNFTISLAANVQYNFNAYSLPKSFPIGTKFTVKYSSNPELYQINVLGSGELLPECNGLRPNTIKTVTAAKEITTIGVFTNDSSTLNQDREFNFEITIIERPNA